MRRQLHFNPGSFSLFFPLNFFWNFLILKVHFSIEQDTNVAVAAVHCDRHGSRAIVILNTCIAFSLIQNKLFEVFFYSDFDLEHFIELFVQVMVYFKMALELSIQNNATSSYTSPTIMSSRMLLSDKRHTPKTV